ncbi:NAD-dependent epimerase/dehydratase family protein [Allonocardiopsis opalescens]|uniref:Nucleoside-diphosphate-sugar epimerase n=1 Tax=Allonocardiopsis opalescens TaxID=1144618 RepID=A0A2T0Q887_9ACTN|nr:NAD(P)-dependent oxidoreductase [Allonocardiopsis opalescens]PRY00045.1 nucleoside-diphosphate-sugar epimerase [Allonocardiopsis opalescens]
MDIFLTGGSGFAGQHMITRLVADGHTVRALARSPEAARKVEQAGAAPVLGDLTDLRGPEGGGTPTGAPAPAWPAVLDRCEAVVHSAARMEFWGPDAGFERDNHRPTVALFAAAAAAGVKRFVLISAAAVSTDRRSEPAVVDEATPTGRPLIAYGRVKLATERALADTATPGMALITLRPPFIWGKGMTTLRETAEAAAGGGFAWIDDGRHVMDFVHVGNLAAAVAAALSRGRDRGVYYVTDGAPMRIRDFFTPVLATMGADVSGARSFPLAVAAPLAWVLDRVWRLLRRPTPPPLYDWLVAIMGRDRSYDISRARAELAYRPSVSFSEGLEGLQASVR